MTVEAVPTAPGGEVGRAADERSPDRAGRPLLVGWLIAVAILAGSAVWLWATSQVGARPLAPVAGGVVALGAVFLGDMASRATVGRRALAYLSVLALFALLVGAGTLGTFVAWRYGGSIDRLVPVADDLLAQPAVAGQPCGPAPAGVAWGDLGRPDDVCTDASADPAAGRTGEVQFWWGSRELIYEPGNPRVTPSASCVRHLSGPWWEAASPAIGCPYRFEGQGSD